MSDISEKVFTNLSTEISALWIKNTQMLAGLIYIKAS